MMKGMGPNEQKAMFTVEHDLPELRFCLSFDCFNEVGRVDPEEWNRLLDSFPGLTPLVLSRSCSPSPSSW